MNVYIFAGPTISATEAGRKLKAVYLPPAAEGDVCRVVLEGARAIGIIDGYFQSVPAVRHKEILWAMSRGIHVFGSASIGALRAAELAPFGMEGVGTVFELYRDGTLEEDGELLERREQAPGARCGTLAPRFEPPVARSEPPGLRSKPICAKFKGLGCG